MPVLSLADHATFDATDEAGIILDTRDGVYFNLNATGTVMLQVALECDTLDQVTEAKAAGADVIMLDNMDPDAVADAVKIIDGAAKVEVSGGVTLDTVGAYANAGADLISVGLITHSVPALDIGLDVR